MAWFWTIIQLLIRLLASFWIYGGKISLGFWFEIEGLNQRISYWKLRKIISRVYQVIKNSFQGGFMACFLTSIQLLIHSSASFLELRYQNVAYNLIRNWRIESRDILLKLGTVYFKGVSSHIELLLGWLYGLILNNYPVTYSFHGVYFELRYQNVTWNLIQNWRIESTDILFKLTTGYLKSISSHIE